MNVSGAEESRDCAHLRPGEQGNRSLLPVVAQVARDHSVEDGDIVLFRNAEYTLPSELDIWETQAMLSSNPSRRL